jgi:hypothetical protein
VRILRSLRQRSFCGAPLAICAVLILVLALLALDVPLASAQSATASVSGRVTDQSGLVMPDVEVEIKNVDTNVSQLTKTNGDGFYRFPVVKPGSYLMNVRRQSFQTVSVTGITINVQDNLSRNFVLQVGSSSESVTVTADTNNINTTDATVSTVVDRQFAENLPLNGRSFQTLIYLTPGVVVTASNALDGGQFSVNGQRAASNYWMVDGVSANIGVSSVFPGNGTGGTLGSFSVLGGTNSLVSVDALQEFRIQTSTYAPEFGRTPGGQISIVTRSGTNQFHGTAFDYFRNDILDAKDWFDGYTNNPPLPKAKERQNDFGGTFSGPVLKDRIFFFFSYEGLRLRLPQTTLSEVPDDSSVIGGLSTRENAVSQMQPYFNAFPLPNGPEIFVPCNPSTDPTCPSSGQMPSGIAQFNASYSNPASLDAYSLRVDDKLNDRFMLFVRYNYSPSELVGRGGDSGGFQALSVLQPIQSTTQTGTVGVTWVISPTTTNDLRFNYSRTNASSSFSLDNFGGAVPLSSVPFPSTVTSSNGLFQLFLIPLGQFGSDLFVGHNGHAIQRQINLVDNASMQKDSHSFKFGVDFRRLSPVTVPQLYQQQVFFTDLQNAQQGSDFEGVVYSSNKETLLFRNLGLYAQDTWRAGPGLTLTYGLRWDVDFAPSSLYGPAIPAVTGYNLSDISQLGIAPPGTPPFKTTYGNLAPRVGLAYQFSQHQDWQAVLRGGFGVFYDLVSSETGNLLGGISGNGFPPFGAFTFLAGPALGGTDTFPFTQQQIVPPVISPTASLSYLYAFNPHLKLPYTLQWNLALEQALGRQQTLSFSYVGAAGRRLLQTTEFFSPPANPSVGEANFIDNTATSNYNALQVQFQRRLSHGLQALASYTWSHSIDDGSAGSIDLASNTGVPTNPNVNRGPSDFDIRNAFTAAVTYDIQIRRINGFTSAMLRGWSLESIILARSAPPVDVFDESFFALNNGAITDIRPDRVPGQPFYLYGSQCAAAFQVPVCPGGKGFNPAAFTDPPFNPVTLVPLRQGTLSRNALRGFGATQWDFAVHRDFPIHESIKLQFRAEMFNVLNHPNFGPPSNLFTSPQFGGPTPNFGLSTQMLASSLDQNPGGGGFSALYQIGGPRSIQLALKLTF